MIVKDDDYFKKPGLSNSFLKNFERSPAHAFIEKEPTKAMDRGSMIHTYLLEPEEFSKKYVIAPPEILNRKNKPYPEFEKANPDKEIVLNKEFLDLKIMEKNIKDFKFNQNLTVSEILETAKMEFAFYWDDPIQAVLKKGKMDIFFESKDCNVILDLKTTENATTFEKSVQNYGYHRQNAWYVDGIEGITGKKTYFYFIAVETVFPFGVMIFELQNEYVTAGRIKNYKVVESYKQWFADGGNKSIIYPNGVKTLYMPIWLKD